jgi:hypothetical protein
MPSGRGGGILSGGSCAIICQVWHLAPPIALTGVICAGSSFVSSRLTVDVPKRGKSRPEHHHVPVPIA